ncbi:MAG: hypothetical protein O3A01_03180 [bacterium]|nr:hypothetical protein [bacterium]
MIHGLSNILLLNSDSVVNGMLFGLIAIVYFLMATRLSLSKGYLHGLKIILCLLPLPLLWLGVSYVGSFVFMLSLLWISSGFFPFHFWMSDLENSTLGPIAIITLAGLPFISGYFWLQAAHDLVAHPVVLSTMIGIAFVSSALVGFSGLLSPTSRGLITRLSLANQHLFLAFLLLSCATGHTSSIYLALISTLTIQLVLLMVLAIIERVTDTTDFSKIGSLFSYAPIAGVGLILIFISAIGSPLTLGYYVTTHFMSSLPNGMGGWIGYGLFSFAQVGILSAFIRLIVFGFFNTKQDAETAGFVRATLLSQGFIFALGIFVILAGVFPNDITSFLAPLYSVSTLVSKPDTLAPWMGLDNNFYWSIILVFVSGLVTALSARFRFNIMSQLHVSALLNSALNGIGSLSEWVNRLCVSRPYHSRLLLNLVVFGACLGGVFLVHSSRLNLTWLSGDDLNASVMIVLVLALLIISLFQSKSATLATVHVVLIGLTVAYLLSQQGAHFLAGIIVAFTALFLFMAIQLFRMSPNTASYAQFPTAFRVKSWDWAAALLSLFVSLCVVGVAGHARISLDAIPIGELIMTQTRLAHYPTAFIGFFSDLHAAYTLVFALALCAVFLIHQRSNRSYSPVSAIKAQFLQLSVLFASEDRDLSEEEERLSDEH